jgi:hypothetical protein
MNTSNYNQVMNDPNLYGINLTGTKVFQFKARSFINIILVVVNTGNPIIKIGTAVGLEDVYPTTDIVAENPATKSCNILINQYVPLDITMYATITNGSINFLVDYADNLF